MEVKEAQLDEIEFDTASEIDEEETLEIPPQNRTIYADKSDPEVTSLYQKWKDGRLVLHTKLFSYEQFHRQLKVVGRFCLTLAFLLMGGVFMYTIWGAVFIRLYNARWMITGVISFVSASFLYFIIPQWSLHQLLKRTKDTILNHFKDSYEATKHTYMQKLTVASPISTRCLHGPMIWTNSFA